MAGLKRSVSYCTNPECGFRSIGRFRLGRVADIEAWCSHCESPEDVVHETFDYSGGQPWRQVRIEYDYCPLERRYRGLAIVTNEDMKSGGVHTFRSPVIKTQRRALEVAEARLSNLATHKTPDHIAVIVDLDWSIEEWRRSLRALAPSLDALAADQKADHEDQPSRELTCERHVPCVCE